MKAIIFDFDGVVVESEPVHFRAFQEVMAPLGITFDYDDYQRDLIGFDDREAFAFLLEQRQSGPEPTGTVPSMRELCMAKLEVFERLIVEDGMPAVPGTLELIDEAHAAGFPIAIASGATRADIELILADLDRRDRFEIIVTADDVQRSKPDPTTYRLAAEKLGVAPGDAWAIEDTDAGLASATDAGLRAIALLTTCPEARLHRAERIIPNLTGVTLETLRGWW